MPKDSRECLKSALSQSYKLRMTLWDTQGIIIDLEDNAGMKKELDTLVVALDNFINSVETELNS